MSTYDQWQLLSMISDREHGHRALQVGYMVKICRFDWPKALWVPSKSPGTQKVHDSRPYTRAFGSSAILSGVSCHLVNIEDAPVCHMEDIGLNDQPLYQSD